MKKDQKYSSFGPKLTSELFGPKISSNSLHVCLYQRIGKTQELDILTPSNMDNLVNKNYSKIQNKFSGDPCLIKSSSTPNLKSKEHNN
jgi:hypothetical protein